MAQVNYKQYVKEDSGLAEYIADVTAAYSWTRVESTDTGANFYLSNGCYVKVGKDSNNRVQIQPIREDGAEGTVFAGEYVAFINTTKVFAIVHSNSATATFASATGYGGIAISKGINVVSNMDYPELLSEMGAGANIVYRHYDDTTPQGSSSTITATSITTLINPSVCIAEAAYSHQSSVIAEHILLCAIHPQGKLATGIILDNQKYYQMGSYLFADY